MSSGTGEWGMHCRMGSEREGWQYEITSAHSSRNFWPHIVQVINSGHFNSLIHITNFLHTSESLKCIWGDRASAFRTE